ncbi:HNH endonuclease signature motif containing protein [Nocardioides pantholopis]|uniref:HNH endonuclease signature motif containing protein n=1 Tax=Nocardioides pantholopis TaxID=2483798 RepID=UPI0013E3C1CA|nr:HNH endonuclease signature motif containing protein [Nocardioides pantholopis]
MVHPIRVAARELGDVLKSVVDVNPAFMDTCDKAAALVELAAVESRVAELRLRVCADAGDVAEAAGTRDVGVWAAAETRRRRGECAGELRLALALADRPVLAAGVREGRVNLDQAQAIAASLADLPSGVDEAVVDEAEAALVAYAATYGPIELRRLGRRILDLVAPEVAEAAEARKLAALEASAHERMRLRIHALGDGTTRISGRIPDASAARLATYLHAFTNPRRDNAPAPAEPVRAVPYGRKTAQAFCDLLEALDPARLPIHGGDATTLVVTISLTSLRERLGTATLGNPAPGESHDRITAAEARRLACTAQIVPAVLGGDSEVLDLGRSQRLFTRAQRRALALRDRECRAEGCQIPAAWCEAHHRDPWSTGGRTDLADGMLLCSHHHHRAHDGHFAADRLANGDLRFHRRT